MLKYTTVIDISGMLLARISDNYRYTMNEQRQHLEELRQTHQRRLQALQKQEAALGVRTPAEISTEIADIQTTLSGLDKQLGPTSSIVLPPPVPDFVGREKEIDQIVQMVNQAAEKGAVAAISG